MAQQGGGVGAGSGALGNQFGDTTYTKVFVGGLAWETQRDTMRRHFEQFGDILEAVVITDKNTGRSKGYGFVTFRDADSAKRACADATPIIDGRRANCNLASLGAHRHRPHGQHGVEPRRRTEPDPNTLRLVNKLFYSEGYVRHYRHTRIRLGQSLPTVPEYRQPLPIVPVYRQPHPSYHNHWGHGQGNRFRPVSPFSAGPQQGGPGFSGAGSFPQTGSPYGHPAPQAFYPPYGGYQQYPQDYASYPPNLFQYGGPQYAPQMYGAPSGLSPGSGPVYQYGSFTTQPLQGGPVYPGSQYAFQTPHLYGPSGANLTTLPQAYGGAGTIPTSTPTAGVSPSLSAGTVAGQVSPQQYALASGSQQPYSSGGGSEQQSG